MAQCSDLKMNEGGVRDHEGGAREMNEERRLKMRDDFGDEDRRAR